MVKQGLWESEAGQDEASGPEINLALPGASQQAILSPSSPYSGYRGTRQMFFRGETVLCAENQAVSCCLKYLCNEICPPK